MSRAELTPFTLIPTGIKTNRIPEGDSYDVENPYGLYSTETGQPLIDLGITRKGKRTASFSEQNKDDDFDLISKKPPLSKYDLIPTGKIKKSHTGKILHSGESRPSYRRESIRIPHDRYSEIPIHVVPRIEIPLIIAEEVDRQVALQREGLVMGNNLLQNELDEARADAIYNKTEIARLQTELDAANEKIRLGEVALNTEQELAAELRADINDLTSQIDQMETAHQVLQAKLKTVRDATTTLRRDYDTLQGEYAAYQNNSVTRAEFDKQLHDQLASLTEQLQDQFRKEREIDRRAHEKDLDSKDERWKEEIDKMQARYVDKVADLTQQLTQLAQQLTSGHNQSIGALPDLLRTIIQETISTNGTFFHSNGSHAASVNVRHSASRTVSDETRQKRHDAFEQRKRVVDAATNELISTLTLEERQVFEAELKRLTGKDGKLLRGAPFYNVAYKKLQELLARRDLVIKKSENDLIRHESEDDGMMIDALRLVDTDSDRFDLAPLGTTLVRATEDDARNLTLDSQNGSDNNRATES